MKSDNKATIKSPNHFFGSEPSYAKVSKINTAIQKYQLNPSPSIYTSSVERQSRRGMKTLSLLILLSLLSGCGSTANQPNTTNNTLKPWFCQSSQDSEDWDCVRSESLVRNPTTAALKQRTADKKEGGQFSSADSLNPEEPTTQIKTDSDKRAGTENQSKALESAAVPEYIRLAYSSEKEISLLALPKTLWAVQLIALSKKEALEEFANQTQLLRLSGARIASKNQILYVLLLGIYETKDLAKQALASVPKKQKQNISPWIRSMGSLQTAMIQGDRLAQD